jgi:predicted acylesterase/phospholipase RssA
MAIKSILFCLKKSVKPILVFLFVVQFVACSGLKTRSDIDRPAGKQDSSVKFPTQFPGQAQSKQVEPATPVSVKKPKVGLILGPGGAKAFAHIGVLKELEKARIPIDYVVGIEHGALVGALYAVHGKANEVEWKMNKIEHVNSVKGFFKSGGAPKVETMDKFIEENFPKKSTSDFAVGFGCPMVSTQSGYVKMAPSGSVKESIYNCLPYPPLFRIERNQVAGLFGIKEAAESLRAKGAELIIYINVLDQGVMISKAATAEEKLSAMLWFEFRRSQEHANQYANELIEVTTRGIELADFKERRKLISLGEQAGSKAANRLSAQYGF